MEGFDTTQSMITVFSCSDYGGSGNKMAVICINKYEELVPKVLHPMGGR